MSVPAGPHTATTQSATRHDDAGFDGASWAVLAFAVLFLAITALVAWHRLTLPDDGSALYLDSGNTSGLTTTSGRTIVAVEGQPAADILLRALTLRPSPPGNWDVGRQVVYTHPTGDQVLMLQRRTAGFENNPARNAGISSVFLIIALFAFVRRPRNRAARLLLLFPVMLIANEIAVIPSDGWAAVSLADLFSPFAYWPAEFYNQFLHVFSFLLMLHFLLVFPTPKRVLARHPLLVPGILYGCVPFTTAILLVAHILSGNVLTFWANYGVIELGATALAAIASIIALWHSFATVRDDIARAQLRWVGFGFVIVIVSIGLFIVIIMLEQSGMLYSATLARFAGSLFGSLQYSTLVLALTVAIAILRYRLFEIDIIINRALVYGLLTTVLGLAYIASVVGLQAIVWDTGLSSQVTSTPVVVVSTLAVAALFNPMRRHIQHVVDRRFYRESVDFQAAFTAFTQDVRAIISLPELLQVLVERTTKLLHIAHGAVFLRAGDGALIRAESHGLPPDGPARLELDDTTRARLQSHEVVSSAGKPFALLVPLTAPNAGFAAERQWIGVLALGARLSGQRYGLRERALLLSLADQAGTAISVAQLVEEQRAETERRQAAEQRLAAHRASPIGRAEQLAEQVLAAPGTAWRALFELADADSDAGQLLPHLPRLLDEAGAQAPARIAEGLSHLAASHASPELLAPGLRALFAGLDTQAEYGAGPALDQTRALYRACQSLLNAATIAQIVERFEAARLQGEARDAAPGGNLAAQLGHFGSAAAALRAAEQVTAAEDRLAYLADAIERLNQVNTQARSLPGRIDQAIVHGIAQQWLAVAAAALRDTQTRPRITCTLLTRQVWRSERLTLLLAIQNSGRGAARMVMVELLDGQEYRVVAEPAIVADLAAGGRADLELQLAPLPDLQQIRVRFRIAATDSDGAEHAEQIAETLTLLAPPETFQPIANPYVVGTPLRAGSPLFVGREDLVQFIGEHLGALNSHNLVLIGQRRTGKTSLLKQLPAHLGERVLPIYLDGQALGLDPGLANFFLTVATEIAYGLEECGLAIALPQREEFLHSPALAFERGFLARVRAAIGNRRLVLLLDEFEELEAAVHRGTLDSSVFGALRHLMQHTPDFSMIFCGTQRIEELTAEYWSALFNIAIYRHVGFLTYNAAMRLVCEPVAGCLSYDDLALDKIWRVTSGQPYFLQLLCYTIVSRQNRRRRAYVSIDDVNAALEDLLRSGEAHFHYLWAESSAAEQLALVALSQHPPSGGSVTQAQLILQFERHNVSMQPTMLGRALQRLVTRDILTAGNGGESQGTLYRWKLGLLGLWIARTRPLNRIAEEVQR